jgi:hypothetical protein
MSSFSVASLQRRENRQTETPPFSPMNHESTQREYGIPSSLLLCFSALRSGRREEETQHGIFSPASFSSAEIGLTCGSLLFGLQAQYVMSPDHSSDLAVTGTAS